MDLPAFGRGSRRRMRWRESALMGLATVASLLVAGPAYAQQQPDSVEAVVATLEHVRGSIPEGRAIVDPRIICGARLFGWSCPPGLAERVERLEISLGSREFSHLCTVSLHDCQLVGTDVLVDLTELRMFGRTATILADVWWRTGDATQPVGHRRSHLHLRRNDDWTWRVTGEEIRVPDEVLNRTGAPGA